MPCIWLLVWACLLSWRCLPGVAFSPLRTLRRSRSLVCTGTLWILSGFFSIHCSIFWGKTYGRGCFTAHLLSRVWDPVSSYSADLGALPPAPGQPLRRDGGAHHCH